MNLFKTKKQPITGSQLPRVSKLQDSELYSWFNICIMEIGNRFDQWRHHDEPLDDIDNSMLALNELWTEIRAREDGRSST